VRTVRQGDLPHTRGAHTAAIGFAGTIGIIRLAVLDHGAARQGELRIVCEIDAPAVGRVGRFGDCLTVFDFCILRHYKATAAVDIYASAVGRTGDCLTAFDFCLTRHFKATVDIYASAVNELVRAFGGAAANDRRT